MIDFNLVKILIKKEIKLFMNNGFFTVITVLGLVFYLLTFFLLPKTVNETLEFGIYAPTMPPILQQFKAQGLKLEAFTSEEKLKEAVLQKKVVAGIVFPADYLEKITAGEKPALKIFLVSELSAELKDTVELMLNEITYWQIGKPLLLEVKEELLGPDMIGKQIPPRKMIIPLFAFFLIITESWGLANLIAEEIEKRTIQALLVTPVTIREIFIAKGTTGTLLAFSQALIFLALTGGLAREPILIITSLLLGALLVTGISFLIGSVAKDLMSILAWGVISFIALSLPSFNLMFPGAFITNWIKVIPSYYLVETIYRVMNFDYGWKDTWLYLLYLLIFALGFLSLGTIALRRRYQ